MYLARIRQHLPWVEERIEAARERAGIRREVTLVVVTKGHPLEAVAAVRAAGLRICGENRVQELETKVAALGRDAVEWHLIGHLQRNKVRRAIPLFDMVQSIDSIRLARELSAEAERAGAEVRGLVQVNTSGEARKGGVRSEDGVEAIVEAVSEIAALPRLRIEGLMTMAPLTDDEATLRRVFGLAREAFDRCREIVEGFQARYLSMGMTNDYEVAVEEGSTMVRLGTALLGEREP